MLNFIFASSVDCYCYCYLHLELEQQFRIKLLVQSNVWGLVFLSNSEEKAFIKGFESTSSKHLKLGKDEDRQFPVG